MVLTVMGDEGDDLLVREARVGTAARDLRAYHCRRSWYVSSSVP